MPRTMSASVLVPDGASCHVTGAETYSGIGPSGTSAWICTGNDTGNNPVIEPRPSAMRAIAGSPVRSPVSTTQPASAGSSKEPFGTERPTRSPTHSVWAHSVTNPCSCTTCLLYTSDAADDRTV